MRLDKLLIGLFLTMFSFSVMSFGQPQPWKEWQVGDAWDIEVEAYPMLCVTNETREEVIKETLSAQWKYYARFEIKGRENINGQYFWIVEFRVPSGNKCINLSKDVIDSPPLDLMNSYLFWISEQDGELLKMQIFYKEKPICYRSIPQNRVDNLLFYENDNPSSSDGHLMINWYFPRWIMPFHKLAKMENDERINVKKEVNNDILMIHLSYTLKKDIKPSSCILLSEKVGNGAVELKMSYSGMIESKKDEKMWEFRELWKKDVLWWSEYETYGKYSKPIIKAKLVKETLVSRVKPKPDAPTEKPAPTPAPNPPK